MMHEKWCMRNLAWETLHEKWCARNVTWKMLCEKDSDDRKSDFFSSEPWMKSAQSLTSTSEMATATWDHLPTEVQGMIMATRMKRQWRDVHRECGRHGYKDCTSPGLHRNSVPCAVPGCKNNVRHSLLVHDYTQCAKCCNRFERDHPFMDHLSGMRGAKCNSLAFWKVLDDATIG